MKYRIAEILCVVLAVLFIAFSLSLNAETDKTAAEISDKIIETVDASGLAERDGQFFKKTFSHAADEFDGIAYYSSDDVMNVSEMLVIKLKDSSDASETTEFLDRYVSSRYDIFAAYAPEQGEMLKNHILKKKGNMIFMYIGKDSDAALDAFNGAF